MFCSGFFCKVNTSISYALRQNDVEHKHEHTCSFMYLNVNAKNKVTRVVLLWKSVLYFRTDCIDLPLESFRLKAAEYNFYKCSCHIFVETWPYGMRQTIGENWNYFVRLLPVLTKNKPIRPQRLNRVFLNLIEWPSCVACPNSSLKPLQLFPPPHQQILLWILRLVSIAIDDGG